MLNALDSLRQHSIIVADTGDLDAVAKWRPQDTTTNPSILLSAAQDPRYRDLVEASLTQDIESSLDRLFVAFGCEILKIIPGRVSTEVDARLSFDTEASIAKARQLVSLYENKKVDRTRILIKLASTWQGIRAAEVLEREDIHCNLTLLFGFAQAVACAEAGVTLISPFVGRIYDYWKADRRVDDIPIDEDPGVASVTRIYEYYKKFGYPTQVMGASFRKAAQIERLCGCDLLTISPNLLDELRAAPGDLEPRLTLERAAASAHEKLELDEASFLWLHNEDPMAVQKLAEGIRLFDRDARKLESFARERVATH